jgi:hypothetical protein
LIRRLDRQAQQAISAASGAVEMALAARGLTGQPYRLSEDGTMLLPVQQGMATPPAQPPQ